MYLIITVDQQSTILIYSEEHHLSIKLTNYQTVQTLCLSVDKVDLILRCAVGYPVGGVHHCHQ